MAEQINESEKKIIKLKERIAKYTPCSTLRFEKEKPKERVPDVLRIGLLGPPGAGKSALINSFNFATLDKPDNESDDSDDDSFSWDDIAPEGHTLYNASKTVARTSYQVAKHIEIFDNRGINQIGSRYMVEVGHQVAGVRHDSERVEWDVGYIRSLVPGIERAIRASDQRDVHCTVLVVSALNLSIKPDDLKGLIDEVVNMTGSPPVVVITHRNQEGVSEKVLSDFRTGMHYGFDHIFEIENYTRENHKYDAEKHLVLLQILKQCTKVGDRVIKFKGING